MNIDITVILEDLKEGRNPRTQRSLDKLNAILEEYTESGKRDFSITTIGRVSSNQDGPGYQSLRATSNEHYRRLIEAWATKAGTTTKKPLSATSRSRDVPADHKLLERIPDIAVRSLFGQIIAERNRYRTQLNLLKESTEIVIDKRPVRYVETKPETSVEILPAFDGVLSLPEIKALTEAVSDEHMEKNGWQYTAAGQVKNEDNIEIFPRGFVSAVRKVLGEVSDD